MKFIKKLKLRKLKINFATKMAVKENINLENQIDGGVVIRLRELSHLIERLHVRFGLQPKEIGRRLKLHERSVLKLMNLKTTKEQIEI